jgi:hypothetical protein
VAALGIAVAGILWALLRGVSGFSPSQVIILRHRGDRDIGNPGDAVPGQLAYPGDLRPVSNAAAVAGRIAWRAISLPLSSSHRVAPVRWTLHDRRLCDGYRAPNLVGAIRGTRRMQPPWRRRFPARPRR